jgi:hypothetical protein
MVSELATPEDTQRSLTKIVGYSTTNYAGSDGPMRHLLREP